MEVETLKLIITLLFYFILNDIVLLFVFLEIIEEIVALFSRGKAKHPLRDRIFDFSVCQFWSKLSATKCRKNTLQFGIWFDENTRFWGSFEESFLQRTAAKTFSTMVFFDENTEAHLKKRFATEYLGLRE